MHRSPEFAPLFTSPSASALAPSSPSAPPLPPLPPLPLRSCPQVLSSSLAIHHSLPISLADPSLRRYSWRRSSTLYRLVLAPGAGWHDLHRAAKPSRGGLLCGDLRLPRLAAIELLPVRNRPRQLLPLWYGRCGVSDQYRFCCPGLPELGLECGRRTKVVYRRPAASADPLSDSPPASPPASRPPSLLTRRLILTRQRFLCRDCAGLVTALPGSRRRRRHRGADPTSQALPPALAPLAAWLQHDASTALLPPPEPWLGDLPPRPEWWTPEGWERAG